MDESESVSQVEITTRSNALLAWVYVAAVALITYVVFSPSLKNGFTNLDDYTYVINNPLVAANSVSLVKIFETPVSGNYHPITILSLALNYRIGKLNPFGYHLVNLIFHLLNTIFVFFFIFLLTRRNLFMAVAVALLFGIHPMHIESVAWISERKDVLYIFFFLLGLITYLRYYETKKTGWYIATFLFFILSCLSKGMAVVFPVILLLIDYLNNVKMKRQLIIEKAPFFLVSLVMGTIAVKVQQSIQSFIVMRSYTIFQRVLFASNGAVQYIVKIFIPYKLSAIYPYPDIKNPDGIPIVFYLSPFILLLIISALIYCIIKKKKEIVFGLLFYFVSIVFVLQFVSVGYTIMADRYSYLSYIGLLFVVAWLSYKIWCWLNSDENGMVAVLKYPFILLIIGCVVLYGYRAYSHIPVWKNGETLWTDVITNYPDAEIAYVSRGNYYNSNNEPEKAIADYTTALQLPHLDVTALKSAYCSRGALYALSDKQSDLALADLNKAIELDPDYRYAYVDRGAFYLKNGKTDLALADFNKAITIDSTDTIAYNSRGLLYLNAGKINLAISDFSKVIKLNPAASDAYNSLGSLYYNAGKNDSALAYFTKAIDLNPASVTYYYDRGFCYNALGQYDKAVADFTACIRLDPQNAAYYNTRGLFNVNLKKYYEAIADLTKAISYNPSSAIYYYNRGLCYNSLNDYESALNDFTRGIQLNPANADLYYNMRGVCDISLSNYKEAISDFSKAIELNPTIGGYWLNRSIAEVKTGQNALSKADALKAQQLQVPHP